MHKFRLHADDTFLVLAPPWADLGTAWQYTLLALLLLVPLALFAWLGRYELRLIGRLPALGLLSLRLVILAVLWLAIGFQPHLEHVRTDETPGRVRIAVDLSTSMDVVDQQRSNADALTRKQIVARILSPAGSKLLERLQARHQVEIIGFERDAKKMTGPLLLKALTSTKPNPDVFATDLNQALTNVTSMREQPLLGILLFSDGQHNLGSAPLERSNELGKQSVPIFPIVIGSREAPNDLIITKFITPKNAFKDTTVQIAVECKVTNMPAQDMTVEMQIDGKPVQAEHRQNITHKGKDDVYTVRLQAKMDEVGTHTLSIKAASLGKEIALANNVAERIIRVTDDRARVLVVDGEARWEYHYLTNALMRDSAIALDRVVFSQPRIGALKDDQLEKAGLAKRKLPEVNLDRKEHDPLLAYDCIVLGDVSPEDFPSADRSRLERFVSERGGTLILVAGKRYLPMAYQGADDPLVKMLPIAELRELNDEKGFRLSVTKEGKQRPFLQLEPGAWPELPKHYWGIVGKRKPAATVLLTPQFAMGDKPSGDDIDTGIIVQQNYGLGRVVFVGIDSTWRWRYRVGDVYHHRFWGQLARWSAAERLLPTGNRFVRFGSLEATYAEGDEVELAVQLSETLPPLKDLAAARAKLYRRYADGTEHLVADVPLAKHPRQRNRLEAKVRDLAPGTHRIALDIPQYHEQIAEPSDAKSSPNKEGDLFRVLPRDEPELLDLSTNWTIMQSLADHSGGTLYTPENIEEILERLEFRIERTTSHGITKPWEDKAVVWWMLGLLVGLLTVEWGWRKGLDLP